MIRLLPVLLLSACGLAATHEARDPLGSHSLIGSNITDLEVCAGPHDKVMKLTDERLLFEWQTNNTTKPAFNLTIPVLGSLELGQAGTCKMTADVLREGTVADIDFPDATSSIWEGPYGSCSDVIRECLLHHGSTQLPPGWDAFATFLPTKP